MMMMMMMTPDVCACLCVQDISNREAESEVWKTIVSDVRLVHVNTSAALKVPPLPTWTLPWFHNPPRQPYNYIHFYHE